MKLSLIAAKSKNGIIGNGPDIPWHAKGEQLLFKAFTFNQWLLIGRKTFESMGVLPNRKYAVVSRSKFDHDNENVMGFTSIDEALKKLPEYTNHLIVAGGGEIYRNTIDLVDTIHLSTIQKDVTGDIKFPKIPNSHKVIFQQEFESNINYIYQIWEKTE